MHAAGESGPGLGLAPPGIHAVCLTVPSEEALKEVAHRLQQAGVPIVSIVESDEPYAGQLMAVGCALAQKEVMRRHLSALPLLR